VANYCTAHVAVLAQLCATGHPGLRDVRGRQRAIRPPKQSAFCWHRSEPLALLAPALLAFEDGVVQRPAPARVQRLCRFEPNPRAGRLLLPDPVSRVSKFGRFECREIHDQGEAWSHCFPMHEDGALDFDALRRLIEWQHRRGTTRSSWWDDRRSRPSTLRNTWNLVRVAAQAARGRIPLVGVPAPIRLGKPMSHQAGGQVGRLRRCRWCRTTQADPGGAYRHFAAVAEAVDLPMILYNVPGARVARAGVDTTLRLGRKKVPGIVG